MSHLHREHLRQIFEAATAAVHPSVILPSVLSLKDERLQLGEDVVPLSAFKKIYVAGAGKASGNMAIETERILGELIVDGVVAVKDFPGSTLKYIRPIVAGHPAPDANSVVAAEEITKLVHGISKNDLLIFLLSGGASSLVMDLPDFCTLEDVKMLNTALVNSGASIQEINTVRKQLSQLKGGKLVELCKGTIVSFIISDVPGNDLSVIGSGPTVPDNTNHSDALKVVEKYKLRDHTSPEILKVLSKDTGVPVASGKQNGRDAFRNVKNYIVGDIGKAMSAARSKALEFGYEVELIENLLVGNTSEEARKFVNHIMNEKGQNKCFIAGGETTLNVGGTGKGGRNQHFALEALTQIGNNEGVSILAAGTDGSDGPTEAAGGFADSEIYRAALSKKMEPSAYLHQFDSYNFLKTVEALFVTGPTGTNVADIVIGIKH